MSVPQVVASSFPDDEVVGGFKGVVELLFVPMKTARCPEDISIRCLVGEELPKIIGIVKVVSFLFAKYTYSGKHEKKVLSNLGSAVRWYEAPAVSSEVLMVCTPSCKRLCNFARTCE